MQNVVNYLTPFLLAGKPIVNGRVYFVKEETAALTFSQLSGLDSADFVTVYDRGGHPLENPLSLNAEGTWDYEGGKQPFVDDGIDFKMIVCRPTGIDPDLNDETPAWELAYTMVSKAGHVSVTYSGIGTVDSISDLRTLSPEVGQVLVLGYGSAGDFCPPRVFTWVSRYSADNGGTKIRSSVQGYENRGMWICEPVNFVDVRWFGVDPYGSGDYSATLIAISQAYPGIPVYFPTGNYYVSSNLSFKSAIIERNAYFTPSYEMPYVPPVENDLSFTVESHFENRGGRVLANEDGFVAYPKVRGELRTSWLESPINSALSSAALAGVDTLVFDSTVSTSSVVTVSDKVVLVKKGSSLPNTVTLTDCIVFDENDASFRSNELFITDKSNIKLNSLLGINSLLFQIVKNGTLQPVLELGWLMSVFHSKLHLPEMQVGTHEGEDEFQDGWLSGQMPWGNNVALYAHQAFLKQLVAPTLMAGAVSADSMKVDALQADKSARFDDESYVTIGSGQIVYYENPGTSRSSYSDNLVDMSHILDYYSDGHGNYADLINVVVHGNGLATTLVFPDVICNAKVIVNKIVNTTLYLKIGNDDIPVIGTDIDAYGTNVQRLLVRQPTASEVERYGSDNLKRWVVDPFFM